MSILLFELDILKKQEEFKKETLSQFYIYPNLDKKTSVLVMDYARQASAFMEIIYH